MEKIAKQKDFLLKCVDKIDKYLFDQKEKIALDLPFCNSIFDISKRDYQIYNLKVIAFQIKKLMTGIEIGRLYNFPIDEKKIELIINNYEEDIKRFIQEEKIENLLNNCLSYGQTRFVSKGIFEMILIQCADETKISSIHNTKLYLQNLTRQTSIRLAIELKVKEMIGFKSYQDNKGQEKFISISSIITFLKESERKWLDIPIDLDELKSIYFWACSFVHNGKIIYEWQIHHALYSLCDLFDITKAKKFDLKKYSEDLYNEDEGKDAPPSKEKIEEIIRSNRAASPNNISYFEADKDIWALEKAMNDNPKIGLKKGVIKLDVKEFGWDSCTFDSINYDYIKSYK